MLNMIPGDLEADVVRGLIVAAGRPKLTLNPKQMRAVDVEALREVGFADEDILEAVQIIAYFNYINRVLDGLGAEPEPNMRFRLADK